MVWEKEMCGIPYPCPGWMVGGRFSTWIHITIIRVYLEDDFWVLVAFSHCSHVSVCHSGHTFGSRAVALYVEEEPTHGFKGGNEVDGEREREIVVGAEKGMTGYRKGGLVEVPFPRCSADSVGMGRNEGTAGGRCSGSSGASLVSLHKNQLKKLIISTFSTILV